MKKSIMCCRSGPDVFGTGPPEMILVNTLNGWTYATASAARHCLMGNSIVAGAAHIAES